jgi:exosome complex exonuclease DIS3/RRP44
MWGCGASGHLNDAVMKSGAQRKCPAVVMLSDDKENLRKAKEAGLSAYSRTLIQKVHRRTKKTDGPIVKEYVSTLDDADKLLDMISVAKQEQSIQDPRGAQSIYPEVLITCIPFKSHC